MLIHGMLVVGDSVYGVSHGQHGAAALADYRRVKRLSPPAVQLPFVLTTGFAFRNLTPKDRLDLVISLHGRSCAALGVKKNRCCDDDADVVKVCNELDFPLILLPSGCSFEEIIDLLVGEIKQDQYKTLADFQSILNPLLEVMITAPNAKTLLVALEDLIRNPVVLLDKDYQFMVLDRADANHHPGAHDPGAGSPRQARLGLRA